MRFKRTTFLNISLNAVLFVLTGPLPALTKKPDTDTNVTLTSGHNNYIPLSESSNITTILQSWTMEFCGARSICYMRRPETVPCDDESLRKSCGLCYCDQCKHYGNCCADKFIGVTPFTDRITCEDYPVRFIMTQKPSQIRLVTKCPINRDPRLTALCEHPQHSQNKRELTPVFGEINQVTYLNEFCAECNGESKVKKWHLNYVFAWNKQALATIVTQLFNDEISVLAYNLSDVYFTPPPGIRTPFCPPTVDTVSSCNKTGLWEKYDKIFEDLCTKNTPLSPSQTITIHAKTGSDSKDVYKNVFCALCNGHMLKLLKTKCLFAYKEYTEVISPPVTTVSLTTDLKDFPHVTGSSVVPAKEKRTKNSIICEHRTVYDPFSDTCRPIRCTDSHYAYNYTCHPIYEVSTGVPYHVQMFYKFPPILQQKGLGSLWFELTNTSSQIHERMKQLGNVKIMYKFYITMPSTTYGFKKEITYRSTSYLRKPQMTEAMILDSMMELHLKGNLNNSSDDIKLTPINEISFFHHLGPRYLILNHLESSGSESFAGLSSDDYIELNILSACKNDMVIVEYNKTEYRVDIENNTVRIQNSGVVIPLNEVVITKQKTLLVCRNFRGCSVGSQQYTNSNDCSTTTFYKFTLRQLGSIAIPIIQKTCGWGSLCNPTDSMKGKGPERTEYCAPCSCNNCVEHGDCCFNFYDEFTSDMRDKMAVWYTTCRAIEGTFNIKSNPGFLSVITTCPTHASANETQRCEESDLDTRYHMNSNMIFANLHCAQCHNYTQLIYANKRVECVWNQKITKWIADGISWEAAKNSSMCDVYNMPPSDFFERACDHNVTEVVNKCPGYKMDKMAVLCKSMYQPVSINKTIYWNIFCAICNGYAHTDNFAGIDKWNIPHYNHQSPEYTVQLKNIQIYKQKEMRYDECVHCAYNQVFDTNKRQCRNFYCHAMYSRTFGRCIERFHSIKGLPLDFSIFYILIEPFPLKYNQEHFSIFNSNVLVKLPRYTYSKSDTHIYTLGFSEDFEEQWGSPRAVEFRFLYVSGVDANYSIITNMKNTMLKLVNESTILPPGIMVNEHKFYKHISKFNLQPTVGISSSSGHPKFTIGLHFRNSVPFIRIILEIINCEAFLKLNQSEFFDLGNDSIQILGAQPIILTQDFDIINGTLYMCSPFKPISCEDNTTKNASINTQPMRVTPEFGFSTAVKQTTTQTGSTHTPTTSTEPTSHAVQVHAERKKYELLLIAGLYILLAEYAV